MNEGKGDPRFILWDPEFKHMRVPGTLEIIAAVMSIVTVPKSHGQPIFSILALSRE